MKLILASKSPRRKEILEKFGFTFDVVTANFNEVCYLNDPERTAKENALGKAKAVYDKLSDKTITVLGSDTIVCLDGEILGKPKDGKEAEIMLKKLSGKTHSVITGYAVINAERATVGAEESLVTFNNLDDKIIAQYVKSGSPLDKAGAYGIQDDFPIVKSYQGSLYNVIGLPIEKIIPLLKDKKKQC